MGESQEKIQITSQNEKLDGPVADMLEKILCCKSDNAKERKEQTMTFLEKELNKLFPEIFASEFIPHGRQADPIIRERMEKLSQHQLEILWDAILPHNQIEYARKKWNERGDRIREIIATKLVNIIGATYRPHHSHNMNPFEKIYNLASLLKGDILDDINPLEDVKKVLRGKKILVLGDEIGTLSQVLNTFGAEAYGIEYDPRVVALAHSGILAENLVPQTQVIEGNLWKLGDRESEFYKQISEKGPFDVIFSSAVFNDGSGFPEGAHHKYSGKYPKYFEEKNRGEFTSQEGWQAAANWDRFLVSLASLVKPTGLNIHQHVEFHTLYGSMVIRELSKKLDELAKSENANVRQYALSELEKMQEYSENYASSGDENIFVERGNMLVHFEQELEKLERGENIL